MRNDTPSARRETGGKNARAFFKLVNLSKSRHALLPSALVVLDFGGSTYRRLTPEHAERLSRELADAAAVAREHLARRPWPPEPPLGNVAALEAA